MFEVLNFIVNLAFVIFGIRTPEGEINTKAKFWYSFLFILSFVLDIYLLFSFNTNTASIIAFIVLIILDIILIIFCYLLPERAISKRGKVLYSFLFILIFVLEVYLLSFFNTNTASIIVFIALNLLDIILIIFGYLLPERAISTIGKVWYSFVIILITFLFVFGIYLLAKGKIGISGLF
jgi:hypothetical protein